MQMRRGEAELVGLVGEFHMCVVCTRTYTSGHSVVFFKSFHYQFWYAAKCEERCEANRKENEKESKIITYLVEHLPPLSAFISYYVFAFAHVGGKRMSTENMIILIGKTDIIIRVFVVPMSHSVERKILPGLT